MTQSKTLGELKASGWKSMPVKEEMRKNLIRLLREKAPIFPGIFGYENTVIPQIVNAILARHDILLLGLRGQAKTRLLRSLIQFLDEFIPAIQGAPLNDDPLHPLSKTAVEAIRTLGDATPIRWIHRSERYVEKLATPDTTVADLIGDIDPIKAASRKLDLADEQVIHFGLIPRANRSIFVINELPDLQPRIQVALLNIMQERDIQIRGFNVRIPLDLSIHFSANPEDYTNRGSIITPLKDRIDSQIITHYPKTIDTGIAITKQEAWTNRDGQNLEIPEVIRQVVEQIAVEARNSGFVDQKSGVSARLTISCLESIVSAAESRQLLLNENRLEIRLSDVLHTVPAITGKVELVYEGEQEGPQKVALHIIGKAMEAVFALHFPKPRKRSKTGTDAYAPILQWFAAGNRLELSTKAPSQTYRSALEKVTGLSDLIINYKARLPNDPVSVLMELAIEGLREGSYLSRELIESGQTYTDLAGDVLGNIMNRGEADIDS